MFQSLVQALWTVFILYSTGEGCSHGDIRLETTDDPTQGYVPIQVCHQGSWRSVCQDNYYWERTDANVACNQLGYKGTGADAGGSCQLPNTNGYLRSVQCNGSELLLRDCTSTTSSDCGNVCNGGRRHAAVYCEETCDDGDIRLVGGSTNREGRVEVCVNGRWGTVCNNSQEGVAGAVCSQLGYSYATPVISFGPGFVPIRNCIVHAGDSLMCTLNTLGTCDHSMDLGVVCHTFEQLCNELSARDTSAEPPATNPNSQETTCPKTDCSTCSAVTPQMTNTESGMLERSSQSTDYNYTERATAIIAALGAVTGVLLVLLLGTVTALVIMCSQRRANRISKIKTTPTSARSPADHIAITSVNVANNAAYEAVTHDQEEESNYAAITS